MKAFLQRLILKVRTTVEDSIFTLYQERYIVDILALLMLSLTQNEKRIRSCIKFNEVKIVMQPEFWNQ